ncbi:MAG TPA: F0F1 ATP synthase subunit B [Candidatus Limnocylindrales bacterium]|nr:F0F1 ATP synthase subunit B [Candidatus Limnocylindrales bacterium]
MEILNNFGFEPILFAAQIVNFLIIFFVLKKFMYKPVLKLLDERKKKIAEGLKQAEESARILEETTKKEEEILKKAQHESKKILDEARSQSEIMLAESAAETKKQVAKMIKDARDQITSESEEASKKLELQVSKLAIEFLEKSLKGLFTDREQEIVMKNAVNKMKGEKNK